MSNRIIYNFTILVLILFSFSCKSKGNFLTGDDGKALELGHKYFEERLLKCGDSQFSSLQGYVEIKGVDFKVNKRELTEADKANGYAWRGNVEMYGKLYRRYSGFPPKWGPWEEWYDKNMNLPNTSSPTSTISISLKNGEWIVGMKSENPLQQTILDVVEKATVLQKVDFTCGDIPK